MRLIFLSTLTITLVVCYYYYTNSFGMSPPVARPGVEIYTRALTLFLILTKSDLLISPNFLVSLLES